MPTEQELSDLADLYYETRSARLKLDREARVLENREKSLKAELVHVMVSEHTDDIQGKTVVLSHFHKIKFVATDWSAIHKYMAENDAMDLVQKRLTDSAVSARLEDGIDLPGIDSQMVDDFTVTVRKTSDE